MRKVLEKQMLDGRSDHILAWKDIKEELARAHNLKLVNAEYLAKQCCIKDKRMFDWLKKARGSEWNIKFSNKRAQNPSQ